MPDHGDECPKDLELLEGVRRGDRASAAELVDRLAPIIERIVFRLTGWHADNQDLVQEVFLAIQQSASSFRGASRIETWATSIAIHRCRAWQRQRNSNKQYVLGSYDEPVDDAFEIERHAEEVREEMRRAMRELKHEAREILVLRYLEGMELEMVAELLGIKKNAVEVRLLRARRLLGAILNQRLVERE